jgi:predicted transposase/invertase (TIGR01784 family)
LQKLCDFKTLQLESGSFIEDDLRAYYSDVLWSLKTCEGDGYIYTIIEHQSTADSHMAFRLMRYAIAVMHRHLAAGHKNSRWLYPCFFIMAQQAHTPTHFVGWTSLMTRSPPDNFIAPRFH